MQLEFAESSDSVIFCTEFMMNSSLQEVKTVSSIDYPDYNDFPMDSLLLSAAENVSASENQASGAAANQNSSVSDRVSNFELLSQDEKGPSPKKFKLTSANCR